MQLANLITVPNRAANNASLSFKSEFSFQVTGICPNKTDNGKPEFARTNPPTTSAGAILLISFNWAIARVGLANTDTIPVAGSMLNHWRTIVIPFCITVQIPKKSKIPIIVNTAATAGIMTKNNRYAPSFAELKIVSSSLVSGVNLGNSSNSTALVSLYTVLDKIIGTNTIGKKILTSTKGNADMPNLVNTTIPRTSVANDWGDCIIVAIAIFCSAFVVFAFFKTGPAIAPAAFISPKTLYTLGIITDGFILNTSF